MFVKWYYRQTLLAYRDPNIMRVKLDIIIKLFLRITVPFAFKDTALIGVDGRASP